VQFRVIDTLDPDAEARTRGLFRVVNGVPGIETLSLDYAPIPPGC